MARPDTFTSEQRMTAPGAPQPAFREKLERRAAVSQAEASVLVDLLGPERFHAAGEPLVQPGVRATTSSLLVAGFAIRTSNMLSGAEAITQIAIPGDFVDLESFLTLQTDQGVAALTDCRVRSFDHQKLAAAIDAQPRLARLLWLESVVDAAIQREWLVRMGRQDALGRLAHFLCELQARLDVVGMDGERFPVPLTQGQLADVLGITAVHANRTISVLRGRGLIRWAEGHVEVLDRAALYDLAEFDPLYLRIGVARV